MSGTEKLGVWRSGSTRRPVVIDVEASGFSPGSYPIEVGVVLEDGGGYCVLVKPEPEWTYWEPIAERRHGLTRELLLRCGLPVTTVAHQLNTLLEGMTVYTEAIGNDAVWLDLLFYRAGLPRLFKLENLCALLPEDRLPLWDHAKREIIEALNVSRRRASADARILQLAAERCVRGHWDDN
ncbi:MAG TPA: hypothetical protein VF268_14845 [Gammaproteobacteria bacterium]